MMNPIKTLVCTLPATAFALGLATFGLSGAAHAESHAQMGDHGPIHVTKSPSCGCCGAWVALARDEGYDVEITDTLDITGIKQEVGVPGEMWACHTATIDGYVVEGHVPFAALRKLLQDRPAITGIAVPGMPAGSPGMGNDPSARYDVLAFGGEAGAGTLFYQAGQ